MKIIKKDGQSYKDSIYLKFDYDPYIIAKIKGYKERVYHQDTKEWELPTSMEDRVREDFKEELAMIEVGDKFILKPVKVDLNLGELPSNFEFKTKPFDHQIEAVRYGMTHERFLLGDEMGLGKSFSALNISRTKDIKHCLIICGVNGIKWNWRNEVGKFTDKSCRFLGQRIGKRTGKIKIGTTKDKVADLENFDKIEEFYIITNIESLREKKISSLLSKLCSTGEIGMVILDEAHKCNNPTSAQAEGLLKLDSKYKMAMTGTPIMNKPIDLYTIFNWLGEEPGNFYSFRARYCVLKQKQAKIPGTNKVRKYWDIVGYRNLEELQKRLSMIMLRRLKEDVLDLPEKIYVDEYVEMEDKQEKVYDEWLLNTDENINQDNGKTRVQNALTQIIRLRQITGAPHLFNKEAIGAKLTRMEELVEEATANNKSVVIFSNWLTMTREIVQKLEKYNPGVITGETKEADRNKAEEDFQSGKTKVLVGTMGAMGTGLTFTKGSVEIFVDEPWTKALKEQCVDRCHRIGQKENVTIYTLLTKDTIDERIHDIVENKGNLALNLVDGSLSVEAINYLLDTNLPTNKKFVDEDNWFD